MSDNESDSTEPPPPPQAGVEEADPHKEEDKNKSTVRSADAGAVSERKSLCEQWSSLTITDLISIFGLVVAVVAKLRQ